MQNQILPSQISVKPNILDLPSSEYEFPDQIRKGPLSATGYYTSNSQQTFDYQGQPWDARGDNWD